jgi:hypothetical protein
MNKTIEAIEYFKQALEKGIETYTITLSSDTPVKKIITEYNKIIENTHPHLIIATPAYLTFPSSNIGTIILEQESASIKFFCLFFSAVCSYD